MKKTFLIATVLLFTATIHALAQKEFKLAKASGKLIINNISNLIVEGYDGKEILFTVTSKIQTHEDPRTKGLTALSNVGFDNTGIGLSLKENEQNIEVSPIESSELYKLKVKLPFNMALSLKTSIGGTNLRSDTAIVVISNLKNEVDASLQYENIKITNVKGPLSIKTLWGNIESTLTPDFKGPVSLVSLYGFIDFTIPPSAKADMTINTTYGTLYAPKDLNLVIKEESKNEKTKEIISNAMIITGDNRIIPTSTEKHKGATSNSIVITGDNKSTPVASVNGTVISETSGNTLTAAGGNFSYFSSPNLTNVSSTGTLIKGSLNGGGEKIVLRTTRGKIYLRK